MIGPRSKRPLTSPSFVRELLESAGVRPSRSMGQNFLVDANVLKVIERAANLSASDTVIEVGAGLGALTQVLVERCAVVYALESDTRLLEVLERELGHAKNLVLLNADAARFDFSGLWRRKPPPEVKMVANLPYRIAATLVIDCLLGCPWITDYTVMVQREVAERMTAGAGSKDYSAATVKIHSRASVRKAANVSRNSFYPRPRVDSAVLRLERLESTPATDADFFDRLVTAAFRQRRKKLVNSISSSTDMALERERVREAIGDLGRSPDARAEDLTPKEFMELSNLLFKTYT